MESFKKQEALKPYFDNAYGFVIFETVAKAGIGIGGAGGKGSVYINRKNALSDSDPKLIGHATLIQLSFGFQFGGQVYSEIIFFESEKDLTNFTSGNFEFGADANVVALTASASASLSTMGNQGVTASMTANDTQIQAPASCEYAKGMKVFTIARGGLMYQATVAGQTFNYQPLEE